MPPKSPPTLPKPTWLDQKFWRRFAKENWEKKPLVISHVKSSLLELNETEIFKLLVLYGDRCRHLNDPEGFKFFIDGSRMSPEEVLQVLPEEADGSLRGYHSRMKKRFADYCLVCDELLQVNMKHQHLLTEFTDGLYREVGFPNRFSEMGLYLGNYRKTPFGVHVDSCGVFSFPVLGVKTFRLWDPEFVEENPALDRALKYDQYKKDSQQIRAASGDMVYWPSSAWHIAESDGSFSATWSLGVWVDQTHQETFSQSLKDLMKSKRGRSDAGGTTPFKKLHSQNGQVNELPELYKKSIRLLKNLRHEELEEALLKEWMKHISSRGFKTIPKSEFKVSEKSKIRLRNKRFLILWQQSREKKQRFFFSFGGMTVESSRTGGLLKLVKALNQGETCLVKNFIRGAKGKTDLLSLQCLAPAIELVENQS